MKPYSRRKFTARALSWLYTLFAFVLLFEGLAVWRMAVAFPEYSLRVCIEVGVLHCIAAGLPMVFSFRPRSFPAIGFYYPRLTGLLTFFLPVIGALGGVVTCLFTLWFVRSKGLAHEFEQSIYHMDADDLAFFSRSMDDLLREELATEPIVDILHGEDEDLKRGAIQLLTRIQNPRAIGLLKESLSDSSTEIRFFAHTALSRLEERATRRFEKLEEEHRVGKIGAKRALATAYLEYARSGLPEDNIRSYYFEQAEDLFAEVLAEEPSESELLIELGNITLERHGMTEALAYFTQALEDPRLYAKGRIGRCKVFWELGEYSKLGNEMRAMRNRLPEDHDPFVRALYSFWADDRGNEGQIGPAVETEASLRIPKAPSQKVSPELIADIYQRKGKI